MFLPHLHNAGDVREKTYRTRFVTNTPFSLRGYFAFQAKNLQKHINRRLTKHRTTKKPRNLVMTGLQNAALLLGLELEVSGLTGLL